MFDIGFGELLLIAVVALVVLGPERLPKAARFAGLWVRRARAQWYSVKSELERELEAEDLKRGLAEAQATIGQAQSQLQEQFGQAQAAVREHTDAVGQELDGIRQLATDAEPGATGATTAPPGSTEATAPAASADPGQAAAPAPAPPLPVGSDGPQRP